MIQKPPKLVGLIPARNEEWILRVTLPAALEWLDGAVVLNHASTDQTGAIIADCAKRYPGKVYLLEESDATWTEMSHRQRMLEAARDWDATHIVTIDADEVLSPPLAAQIRDIVFGLHPDRLLQIFWMHAWRGLAQHRVDKHWRRNFASFAFVDAPHLGWRDDNGYHFHHRHPYGNLCFTQWPMREGAVIHLQHVVWRRLLAKQRWYKCTERLRWPNRKTSAEVDSIYNVTVSECGIATVPIPSGWMPDMSQADLSEGPVPWQETQVLEWIAEHGRDKFEGMDLFGL